MKTIYIRTISGAIFISLIIVSVLFSQFAIGAVLAVASFICIQELLKILNSAKKRISTAPTIATVVVIFSGLAAALTTANERVLLPVVALAFLIPFIHQVLFQKQPSFLAALISGAAALYVSVPMLLLIQSGYLHGYYYPYILLGIFLLTWTYDTFAYLFGISMGKHKLLERVSPKKSVEGLIGGAFVTLVGAWIYSHFNDDISLNHWLAISVIIVVFGTLGDLTESVIKRNFNVKDSGGIMPGHGGLLDRFDGLLFIGPAVYAYMVFVLN
jgi:phosphatidate cytidylyltransferase